MLNCFGPRNRSTSAGVSHKERLASSQTLASSWIRAQDQAKPRDPKKKKTPSGPRPLVSGSLLHEVVRPSDLKPLPALPADNEPAFMASPVSEGTAPGAVADGRQPAQDQDQDQDPGPKTAIPIWDMADPNTFSIKGVPLSFLGTLIEMWGGGEALDQLTTADVCRKHLKPMTQDTGLSLCAQLFLSKNPAEAAVIQDAKWFVSHAWQYKFLEVVDALTLFAMRNQLDPDTTIIWFDLLSNSQHNVAAKPFDWWQTVFKNAIEEIGSVVLVMTPFLDPIPLKRVWCIFEIYTAAIAHTNFHIAMPVSEEENFLENLVLGDGYNSVLASINSQESESSNPSDKEAIFEVIQSVGFSQLDKMVFETLSGWTVRSLQDQIDLNVDGTEPFLTLLNALGRFHSMQGRYGDAEPLLLQGLQGRQQLLGETHPDTLSSLNNLAMLYYLQGQYGDAEPLYLQCVKAYKQVCGENHPDTLMIINNLALLYQEQGRYEDAEPLLLQGLKASQESVGETHPNTLLVMNNLALVYQSQGRYGDAEPLYLQCLKASQETLGETHPDTLQLMSNLATLYQAQGRYEDAEPLLLKCLTVRQQILGETHPDTLKSLNNLALVYQSQGLYGDAEPLYLQCLKASQETLGETHPESLCFMSNLALLYQSQGRYGDAEPLCLQCVKANQETLGENHPALSTHSTIWLHCMGLKRGMEKQNHCFSNVSMPPNKSLERLIQILSN
ncbi:Kinesin light chain 3 [Podochytrium sp. JEL0797]|nr:Kinesin light chain 3 [Podochytrium sp. JEL0797]